MTILVRKNGDVWVRWNFNSTIIVQIDKANVSYADGRSEEITVPAYPVPRPYDGNQVRQWLENGQMTLAEVEALGGKVAAPFELPDGMQYASGERFEEDEAGNVVQVYDIEAIPEPPPPPTPTEKFDAFLESIGLTRPEFLAQLT